MSNNFNIRDLDLEDLITIKKIIPSPGMEQKEDEKRDKEINNLLEGKTLNELNHDLKLDELMINKTLSKKYI